MNMRPNRLFITPWIALCFLGLSACASSMAGSKLEDPRGLIDLNARMPTGDSPYGIAYGAPTPARVRPDSPNIDEFLKPEVVAARPTRVMIAKAEPVKQARVEETAPVAPVAAEAFVVAPEQDPLLAMNEPAAPATGDDSARYADREAKSQNLEQFRGGDAIVITSGALLVILLVIIIILLLN